jgi:hypothetical protein
MICPRIYITDSREGGGVNLFKSPAKTMVEEIQYAEPSFAVRISYVFRCKEPCLWHRFISCEVPASITRVVATKWPLTFT